MQAQTSQGPWWATLTVWGVVNAVNLLQSAGFLSRVLTGEMAVNHLLGYVMIALAAPVSAAIIAFGRARADWPQWTGPAVYLAFLSLMIAVEYVWPVEFRSPPRYGILVPYLVLFFGAILLMGLPMFRLSRGLWLVTVATTALLLASMGAAMSKGVG
jgi:multisubunit Na+/H+ antiporter MnhG subunit